MNNYNEYEEYKQATRRHASHGVLFYVMIFLGLAFFTNFTFALILTSLFAWYNHSRN